MPSRTKRFFVDRAHKIFTTHEAFQAFLEAQPPQAVIGYALSSCFCPLAVFARSQNFPVAALTWGHLDIKIADRNVAVLGVSQDGITENGTLDASEDAPWFMDFVTTTDRLHPKGTPITAERALKILAEVLKLEIHHPSDITEADL